MSFVNNSTKFEAYVLDKYGYRATPINRILMKYGLKLFKTETFGRFNIHSRKYVPVDGKTGLGCPTYFGNVIIFPSCPNSILDLLNSNLNLDNPKLYTSDAIDEYMDKFFCQLNSINEPRFLNVKKGDYLPYPDYREYDFSAYGSSFKVKSQEEFEDVMYKVMNCDRDFYGTKSEHIFSDKMDTTEAGDLRVMIVDPSSHAIEIGRMSIAKVVDRCGTTRSQDSNVNLTLKITINEKGYKNLDDFFDIKKKFADEGVRIIQKSSKMIREPRKRLFFSMKQK